MQICSLAFALAFVPAASGLLPAQAPGVAEGTALLQRLAKAHADVQQITANYVQRRMTKLVKKPLVSSGTLAFRHAPGCVVFRVVAPRVAVIRLDSLHYEVYREEQQRLERFILPSDEMPRLLFDALSLTEAKLRDRFEVAGCDPVADQPTRRRVRLIPNDQKTRRVAAEVSLLIDTTSAALCGFGYTDPRGDTVDVELSDVKTPKDPAAGTFEIDVPKDTKVTVQKIPAPVEDDAPEASGPKKQTPQSAK